MKSDYQDGIRISRPRGKDKMYERFERTGGYSSKHIRIKENTTINNVKPKRKTKHTRKTY